jgi:pimeloyl-ACP methyl ester carboxylesterase
MRLTLVRVVGALVALSVCEGAAQGNAPSLPAPVVLPGSVTSEDVPYPFPVSYLPLTVYGESVRLAYMDVAPATAANGRTVVLLHGMNFAGFYWGGPIDALRREGFRVVVPDQIGFGRSSKPLIPYHFHDMALNTRRLLQHLDLARVMVVGHSMGGMLAARFATQYPDIVERLVIYNPIGLSDGRYDQPWSDTDEVYAQVLASTYQSIRARLFRYVSHKPSAWNEEFERYVRVRYAWTLSAEWPRYAMVQARLSQMPYLDPVVNDWAHIASPTLVFGGREDSLTPRFPERMQGVAAAIPNGKGRLLLLPGLGHVPHVEAPDAFYPGLIAFLTEH